MSFLVDGKRIVAVASTNDGSNEQTSEQGKACGENKSTKLQLWSRCALIQLLAARKPNCQTICDTMPPLLPHVRATTVPDPHPMMSIDKHGRGLPTRNTYVRTSNLSKPWILFVTSSLNNLEHRLLYASRI